MADQLNELLCLPQHFPMCLIGGYKDKDAFCSLYDFYN